MKDQIYKKEQSIAPFAFNADVANVFDDMISRSVPGYSDAQKQVIDLLKVLCPQPKRIFDLGCSTGTFSFQLAEAFDDPNLSIEGIDLSSNMIAKCEDRLKQYQFKSQMQFKVADVLNFQEKNADIVLLNYVLQFLEKDVRLSVLQKIRTSLNPNGIFVVCEKTQPQSKELSQAFQKVHENFKARQNYSKLEIAQKRKALENVLVPLSLEENILVIKEAGFSTVEPCHVWNNFATLIALC